MSVLAAEGLLRVTKQNDKRAMPLLKALRAKEEEARTRRNGLWRYGDVDEDDCMEFGTLRQQEQAKKAAESAPTGAWGKK